MPAPVHRLKTNVAEEARFALGSFARRLTTSLKALPDPNTPNRFHGMANEVLDVCDRVAGRSILTVQVLLPEGHHLPRMVRLACEPLDDGTPDVGLVIHDLTVKPLPSHLLVRSIDEQRGTLAPGLPWSVILVAADGDGIAGLANLLSKHFCSSVPVFVISGDSCRLDGYGHPSKTVRRNTLAAMFAATVAHGPYSRTLSAVSGVWPDEVEHLRSIYHQQLLPP